MSQGLSILELHCDIPTLPCFQDVELDKLNYLQCHQILLLLSFCCRSAVDRALLRQRRAHQSLHLIAALGVGWIG
jgi:hypothetical protein